MIAQAKPDVEKAVEALLYITDRVQDMYAALKTLYFADKRHLAEYGRLIYGDSYVAMSHGPVPSLAYDMLRQDRGIGQPNAVPGRELFTHDGNDRIPLRDPDLALLGESDTECLDEAIARYGTMSFGQLKKLSHEDSAYQAADENDLMSLEAIVLSLPDGEVLLDYLVTK